MYADTFTPLLQRAINGAKLPFKAVYVPADDDSVDDQVEIHRDGKDTGLAVQVGHGYAALNESIFNTKGELTAVKDIKFWDRPKDQRVIADILPMLVRRGA